jgi:hypothetical protein
MFSMSRNVLALSAVIGLAIACGSESSEFGPEVQGADGGPPSNTGVFGGPGNTDAGPVSNCKPLTCADANANCGPIGDGCGGIVDCGTCTVAGEVCGGGGVASRCGAPPCTKLTCEQQGANCGAASDGCGGVIASCGTCDANAGQFCGGGGASKCGTGISGDGGGSDAGPIVCVAKTCQDLGATCGQQGDGCGLLIDCGTCTGNTTCGGGGVPSRCGTACTPITQCPAGQNCGVVADGCGGVVSCGGACATGTCGGGGTPNVCGSPTGCTGLCEQQQVCAGGGTTSISGTVTTPNGTLPIYGALVYVPTTPVSPFTTGVSCEQCGASAGVPLVSTTTGPDGKFLLPNMPVSSAEPGKVQNIPVVVQLGRWRKQLTVATTACTNAVIPTVNPAAPTTFIGGASRPSPDNTSAALARNKADGDIPLTAISTGNVDGLECVFRKIGIDDAEFTNPSGNGRIRFYQDNGAVITRSSGVCSVSQTACTNFGSNCGNRCSGNGRSCSNPGTACSLRCSASGNSCSVDGAACGLRCTSDGDSCSTLGASCDSGRGTCGAPGRCSTTDNRCGSIGSPCDSNRGTCVAELRCTSDGDRCDVRSNSVGSSCDGGDGTCVVDTCGGGTCTSFGTCNQVGGTPAANTLYNDPIELGKYDMTIFECVGDREDKTATQQANVRDYANRGGRVYATHFSYVWLYNTGAAPWNATASWAADSHSWSSAIATLDTSFNKGVAFAQWLNVVGGLNASLPSVNPPWNPPPKITIQESRHDVNDPVVAPAQRWLYTTTSESPSVASVQHYTFNTDWTKPADQQCGRVLFSDFHVTTGDNTNNVVFPAECDSNPLTQQEKVLAFMLFDLASCVSQAPPPATCTPRSCADQGVQCGQTGDGCGNVITCPNCPQGQSCGGGGVPNQCGASSCTPTACPQGTCGIVADGCGGTSTCAPCPDGQTCGGGGAPGVCGSGGGGCTPGMCPAPAVGSACGPVANGCGGLLSCSCPTGTSCINGKCATSACTPRTCAVAGANCGQVADGCGGLLTCGDCLSPQSCGGGGIANVCGGGVIR